MHGSHGRWARIAVAVVAATIVLAAAGGTATAAADVLPNLVAESPDNATVAVDSAAGAPALLLRFNGYIHNVGPGALDIRGARRTTSDRMAVLQRVYDTNGTFTDRPTNGELIYTTADGHNHWHLQNAVSYSLWNSTRTAEVAPSQKVGFCMEDSAHVGPGGPSQGVYTDTAGRAFCQRNNPDALSLFEGISAGWRDIYRSDLAFQWVDASDVQPGSYWLREDVDPTHIIAEADENNAPSYALTPTVISGYLATPAAVRTPRGAPVTVTLGSQTWGRPAAASPTLTIVDQPAHGRLGAMQGGNVVYTPDPGYDGLDAFTFTADDAGSDYPRHPAAATVALTVGQPRRSVSISGAPAAMFAGTSVQLSAVVENDAPGVTWSASAGRFRGDGLYTAPATPPAGGTADLVARSAGGAEDRRTIAILPSPAPVPRPEPPATPGAGTQQPGPLSQIRVVRNGRLLTLSVDARATGRIRLAAFAGRRQLGRCAARIQAGRTFTCRLRLRHPLGARTQVHALATLFPSRGGVVRRRRSAAPVPTIAHHALHASGALGRAAALRLLCPLPPG